MHVLEEEFSFFTLFSKRWNVMPFFGSPHLVFMFWLNSNVLTSMWCYREIVKRVDILVMFSFFIVFSKRLTVLPYFGSPHLCFHVLAYFKGFNVHVMLQRNCQESGHFSNVFIFNILSKFLRNNFFVLFLLIFLQFTAATLNIHNNGLSWIRRVIPPPKEICIYFNVFYYYVWNSIISVCVQPQAKVC